MGATGVTAGCAGVGASYNRPASLAGYLILQSGRDIIAQRPDGGYGFCSVVPMMFS
jgi:hypothetical protein